MDKRNLADEPIAAPSFVPDPLEHIALIKDLRNSNIEILKRRQEFVIEYWLAV